MTQKRSKGGQKTFAAKRTMNPPGGGHAANKGNKNAFQQHDVRNRLGGYAAAGNHARTGNRGHQ